jgi:CheY-like chemotaxis protein
LPSIDGYELARRIRSDPRFHRLPLIALTGYGSERDRERAIAASFNEHLVKPVTPGRLLNVVERLIAAPRDQE